jgi:hypothetical protein
LKRKSLLFFIFIAMMSLPLLPVPQPPVAMQNSAESIQNASLKIVPSASMRGPSGALDNGRLAQDGNLPEAASALPLLSVIGAGMLIGGAVFSPQDTIYQDTTR